MLFSTLLLTVPFVFLSSGERLLSNETLIDADTTEGYHDNITTTPHEAINDTLLLDDTLPTKVSQRDRETPHALPHSHNSNMVPNINKTLLFNDTLEGNVTYEDNEAFQDQEEYHVHWHCNTSELEFYSDEFCGAQFHVQMSAIPKQRWCDWEEVIKPYNVLSICMEYVAGQLSCYYPNQQTHAYFMATHESYFSSCPEEEEVLWDAPPGLALALTLLPVSLLPAFVIMAVWKNSGRE
ncbi:receptor activity-modifying protein 1-like isoform X2 [Clupea harengus]|uniref:Receptor activity-modifying protein 1-like isoform X2 n=1 Tax=Clupea harengus TaxID=7950 RepID=A0A6P3VKT5_CLUHA|nr:receptor activity-modifying protein 1-like isoform X2 [Clupea harengus]